MPARNLTPHRIPPRDQPWRSESACAKITEKHEERGGDWVREGDWPESESSMQARRICTQVCKVRMECLFEALSDPKAQGIRAGFRFQQGSLTPRDARRLKEEFGIKGRSAHKRKDAAA